MTDNRSIWDWTKYKIRAHAIQHSQQKAMERKEKDVNLQKEFAKAKQSVESNLDNNNANALKGGAYYCYCIRYAHSRYSGFPIADAFKYNDIFARFESIRSMIFVSTIGIQKQNMG